ncbi:MAG: Nucleoside-diphosphate-sugar epimerase/Nucleoside-diphosphate-sugar epimerase [Chloroflexi bacterium]|jgi:nucleoside-diphosphate-sugar epimerase|nr:MAG: Nucleoside-diphosphate-sugar epimerase/Nucleoside-diphosphate-sugar epimerase [Chloroflexota bacterium]
MVGGYEGVRVLVTGGTGFIGSRLVERLVIEEKAEVRVLVHHWAKAAWVSRTSADLIEGDVTDPLSVKEAMQGCDVVFHCAAGAGPLEACETINVEGTRVVLQSAVEEGVSRFVHLSTIVVHGPTPPDEANEEDAFRPLGDPYADTKIKGELLAWDFWKKKGLPVTVIRPTFVWGPRSPYYTIEPVQKIKKGQWSLVDKGHGLCHAVYVDNLVDAILLAGVRPEAVGNAFFVTDGGGYTWAAFYSGLARMVGVTSLPSASSTSWQMPIAFFLTGALGRIIYAMRRTPKAEPARFLVRGVRFAIRMVKEFIGKKAPYPRPDMAMYAHTGRLDTSRAEALLGYQPRYNLDEAMHETEVWLRDQNYLS